MLARGHVRPIVLSASIAGIVAAAPAGADTIPVGNQMQFDGAISAATQPGRNDTIDVNAQTISSGAALTLPGQAIGITINFIGVSGPSNNNPTFDVSGTGAGSVLGIGAGTALNFDVDNGVARLRVGISNGTGTVNMTGGTITATGTQTATHYFTVDVGRGSTTTTGFFNQSGGRVQIGGDPSGSAGGALQIGYESAKGTYTMTNNAVIDMGYGTVYVGEGTGAQGTLFIHDNAQFLLNAGSAPTAGQVFIGDSGGAGTVVQDGAGSVVIINSPNGINLGSAVDSPGSGGGFGEYYISAGQLSIGGGNTGNVGLNLGRVATGTGNFFQSGGTVTLNEGQIRFGAGQSRYDLTGGTLQIGVATPFAVTGGATYAFNFGGGTIKALTSFSAGINMNLSNTSTVDTNGQTATLTGVLSGGGALEKDGAGTLVLNGPNTYGGGTQLNAGTIRVGNVTGLGSGVLSFNAPSTLQFGGNLALGNDVTIASGAIANIDSNGNSGATLNGTIGGAGKLDKIGAGVLTLNGAGSYTGGTEVSAGTLRVGNDDRLPSSGALQVDAAGVFDLAGFEQTIGALSGAGGVLLGSTGALTTNTTATSTFSGSIQGNGSFTKGGSGTLTLSGNSTYDGPTTVDGGKLLVNGSIASSDVFVVSGTLGGNGTTGDLTVLGGGTAAPGNSIGTLNVSGGVTFQPGSNFQVEVNGAGASDRIAAAGAATINGGLVQVLAQGGAYSPLMTYTILTSGGLTSGSAFDGVTSNLVFLTPTLDYDSNNVYLRLERSSADFAEFALTRNQLAVANALDAFPGDAVLLPFLLGQDAQGIRQAFDALSGEVHASAASALVMNSFYVREAILSRLIQASYSGSGAEPAVLGGAGPTTVALLDRGSRMSLGAGLDDVGPAAAVLPAYAHGLAFWTRGFGAWGDLNGNGNAAGLDRTLGGFVSGVDTGLGGGWRAGLATGYMHTDLGVGARASAADIDSYVLAGYAGGAAGAFAIRSGGAWTWNSLDTTRNVSFPGFFESERASYDAGTGQLFAEIAYPLLYGGGAVEPFAGLSYVHVGSDRFTESGPIAGLSSGGADQNVGLSLLGVRAGTTLPVYGMTVTPHGSLAWQYAFGDVTPQQALAFASTGIGFGIAGVPIARSSALIEAGLDLVVSEDAVLGINYTGQIASDLNDNSVQGRLNWRF